MKPQPFELLNIKREIKHAQTSYLPPRLTKVTICTSDAIWLVRQVESLQKIADAWRSFKFKNRV